MRQPRSGLMTIVRRSSLPAVLFGALTIMFAPTAALAGSAAVAPPPAPGTVLSAQPMQLSAALANVATGKRITYASRDSNDRSITVSGAVLTPKPAVLSSRPDGATKIVAWAHGTAGLADQCAPSGQPNLFPDPTYNNYADT